MALSVTISTPSGNTPVPCTVSGNAQPDAGQTLCGMGYQINAGPINSLPSTSYTPTGGSYSFTLQTSDCPTVGQAYLLTVYAGETPSGNFANDSDNIVRTS